MNATFNSAVAGMGVPKYLRTDNDPLFLFHLWKAELRVREITEIKTVPCVSISHPFVERLIGTIRREHLDHVLFWNPADLGRKLSEFTTYYIDSRVHSSLADSSPAEAAGREPARVADLAHFRWKKHCGGLAQLPVAA